MSYKTSASCPRKSKARFDTIIKTYRELFHNKLPNEKQYWTLAGPCFDENNKLGKHSEIHQLISSGLITEDQYHGIDNGEEIITSNRIAAPNSNFYHGDFITTLQAAAESKNFNPGIIHADYTKLKETSIVDTSNIIYMLSSLNISNVMVVMNFPWNNPYANTFKGDIDPQEVIKLLQKNQRFNYAWNENWNIYPNCYSYGGTGPRSKTTMATFVLFSNKTLD
jgi:hypothetical protein